jgi:hypothetical protein
MVSAPQGDPKNAVENPAAVGHYPAHVMCNQNQTFLHPRRFNKAAARH